MLKVNAIFNGRKKMADEVMRGGVIMGGKVALAEKLKQDHSWDGRSLIAAPITVMEAGAIVDNYWSVLGELKDLVFRANLLWAKGSKDLKVTIKMEDLGMFDFKDGNLSEWLDKEDLEVSYSSGDGQEMGYEEVVDKHGEVQFSPRLLVIPTSHLGASVWVGASPYAKADIKTRLGGDASSNVAPHITLPIHEAMPHGVAAAGRAAHAVFSRQELPSDGFGFGVIPWMDCSAEGEGAVMPSSDEFKESTLLFLRKSTASAVPTNPQAMETRMEALVAGRPVVPKNPPHVFPEFSPSEEDSPGILRGWLNK